jgi:hypothetical protein
MTITEKLGNKIYEIPATWIEDKDSRVNIWDKAQKYTRDLIKIRLRLNKIKKGKWEQKE